MIYGKVNKCEVFGMDWQSLLCADRLSEPHKEHSNGQMTRSPFRKDYDRIVFSSAFRRMQDKTQVFPLSESDYVRTRLTHSIEVSCVGRSMGTLSGRRILQEMEKASIPKILTQDITEHDFGDIVAAACVAHDIGNPPFGHAGEEAIRAWFKDWKSNLCQLLGEGELQADQQMDLLHFEGNAQGLRLLTRILDDKRKSGLDLTCAVLGAFTKYPMNSVAEAAIQKDGKLKYGFTADDADCFRRVASNLQLIGRQEKFPAESWHRHPLAYLVEAADDVCYRLIDWEDGQQRGCISRDECCRKLVALIESSSSSRVERGTHDNVARLRGQAIGTLVDQVVDAFVSKFGSLHLDHCRTEEMKGSLLDSISEAPKAILEEIKKISSERIYKAPKVVEIEAAGFQVMGGLLDRLVPIAVKAKSELGSRDKKLLQIFHGLREHMFPEDGSQPSVYKKLLAVLDCVAGMTDSYALNRYRLLMGIDVPSA